MFSPTTWPGAACALLLLSGAALADIVTLKDGRLLDGVAEPTRDGKHLRITGEHGEILVPTDDVLAVKKETPVFQILAKRLDALLLGDLPGAFDLARYALDNGLKGRVPEILARGVVPGDVDDTLHAVAFCKRSKVRRALAAVIDHGVGVGALTARRPANAATLGAECLELNEVTTARRLFLFAIRQAPALAQAAAGLRRLDFHLVAGRWVAPEVYYPARGYQRFEGRWRLAAEITAIHAERARDEARLAVGATERSLAVARGTKERALANIAEARSDLARADAALEGARLTLSARERDLDRASGQALVTRRDLDAHRACRPNASTPTWDARQANLHRTLRKLEARAAKAERVRDEALALVQTRTQAHGDAVARIADAQGQVAATGPAIEGALAAVVRAVTRAVDAQDSYDRALRARDAALARAKRAG